MSGTRFGTSVVIGKFLPFHKGHRYLIETALAQSERVTVLVCKRKDDPISVDLRAAWIAESCPTATVQILDQDALGLDDWDSPGWAAATVAALGAPPDAAFTSENYGEPWCKHMGATHVMVDLKREHVPISGTAVRSAPLAHLEMLDPQVRAHFAVRVCVIGAESTGKTTLCTDLSEHYGIPFVAEFGRHYTEAMPRPTEYQWTEDDMITIAQTQNRFEDDAARWIGPLVICDTNSFVTSVFTEAYLGAPSEAVLAESKDREYALHLVCDLATPPAPDSTGLRYVGPTRDWMHHQYMAWLELTGQPYNLLTGDQQERLVTATSAIDSLLASGGITPHILL